MHRHAHTPLFQPSSECAVSVLEAVDVNDLWLVRPPSGIECNFGHDSLFW